MEFAHYTLKGDHMNGAHHRWIQPPQVAYFVSTVDSKGNGNVTPVTMGTCIGNQFFSFTLSNLRERAWDQDENDFTEGVKQGYCNLLDVPECVISYYDHSLVRESWIAAMPIPKGINELDVMGLTPLPSTIVRPDGIAQCPINLEAKVLHTHKLGAKWTNFICEIVHVAVDKKLDEANRTGPRAGYGSGILDLVFEVVINKGGTPDTDNMRLVYERLDPKTNERCPEDVGVRDEWIGGFEPFVREQCGRGKITDAEMARIFDLQELWAQNRDPVSNAAVKAELTALLKKSVAL
ncbi:MAG: flavin reductase [Oscillospiraceae bacterium]|nr:flavin reductase [Oscillospiraceae bacterium]